jgi:tubulin polyglutamylase TTLL2
MSTLENVFSHLTNTSINKNSPTLNSEKEEVGVGCKWSLSRLRDFCEGAQLPFDKIWDR